MATKTTTTCSDDDQSSLDLSMCLRRGSNDSRDSFYMDFDKGIDSDIDVGPHRGKRDTFSDDGGSEYDNEADKYVDICLNYIIFYKILCGMIYILSYKN